MCPPSCWVCELDRRIAEENEAEEKKEDEYWEQPKFLQSETLTQMCADKLLFEYDGKLYNELTDTEREEFDRWEQSLRQISLL